jgi:hypothetical protein
MARSTCPASAQATPREQPKATKSEQRELQCRYSLFAHVLRASAPSLLYLMGILVSPIDALKDCCCYGRCREKRGAASSFFPLCLQSQGASASLPAVQAPQPAAYLRDYKVAPPPPPPPPHQAPPTASALHLQAGRHTEPLVHPT